MIIDGSFMWTDNDLPEIMGANEIPTDLISLLNMRYQTAAAKRYCTKVTSVGFLEGGLFRAVTSWVPCTEAEESVPL